jgi:hypothetical protein
MPWRFFGRDLEVLDLHLGVAAAHDVRQRALGGHRRDVSLDVVAGVRELDDEGGIALVARRIGVGHRHDQRHVGRGGGRREPLLAVQDVVLVAVLHGPRLHTGGVGAGGLLSHRVADALLTVQQRLEELLLLILRAVLQDGQHGGVVGTLRVHRQRAEVALPQLHLHQRVGQGPEPHAAVFLGDEWAPQALRARLGAQLVQHLLVARLVGDALLGGDALVVHPLAHPLPDLPGVFRDLEVDGHGRSSSLCRRYRETAPSKRKGRRNGALSVGSSTRLRPARAASAAA